MSHEHAHNKDNINPAELKIASQFAGNLLGMLKAVHLYPKGHQMLLKVLEKFFNYLNYLLAERESAAIRIFESKLYVLDVCLPLDKTPGIESFIEELQKRYIRQISFHLGVTLTDITALIDVLNFDPDDLAKEGGASLKLAEAGAQATKIIEYYYRRHSDVDQERLLALTNSELFRFFTDQLIALDAEQAKLLYDLLKEPNVISALLKVAAQYRLREDNCELTEGQIILNIINRIKESMISHAISEEDEIQVMLQDVVASFEPKELMGLIFDNPDEEIINYTNAMESLSKKVSPETTAQLITDKISADQDSVSMLAHTKKVLGRLFFERKAFLNFLPLFKEKLQNSLSKVKAKDILNEVCSAFAPGFSFEDGEDLALGAISDIEFKDIVEGLNVLKTVHPDKPELEKAISEFNVDAARLPILMYLFPREKDAEFFKSTLSKLVQFTENMLGQDLMLESKNMFDFFTTNVSSQSVLPAELQNLTIEALQKMPVLLLEKLTVNILFETNPDQIKKHFEELFVLLGEKLTSLLVKIYAREENLPHAKEVKEMIFEHYAPNIFNMDVNLQKELTPNVMRIIDLLQTIKSEDTLPLLWDISFHDNAILAQRALKLIAIRGSDAALDLLLKTLSRQQLHMQIAAIEYLGSYHTAKVRDALLPIAQGDSADTLDETAGIDLRISALKSLQLVDKNLGKKLLQTILRRKRWFIFPVEPKAMRNFAKEQLRQIAKK